MSSEELLQQPHALFGMLLAAEGGASLDRLAGMFGMARKSLSNLLDQARNGECGRVEAACGTTIPVTRKDGKGPVASIRQEVLVQRWKRRIARHLHRHGQITFPQMIALAPDLESGIAKAFEPFCTELAKLGVTFEGRVRKGIVPAVWTLDDEGRARLSQLIAADWRIEVAR